MISRNDVSDLYRLILDRKEESEQAVNEKRKSSSLSAAAIEMLMSEEFMSRNNALICEYIKRTA